MPESQNTTLAAVGVRAARIGRTSGGGVAKADWVTVHFNPTSLQLQVSNELKDCSTNNQRQQYVGKTSVKLTLDLIFDTTLTGTDVTLDTRRIQSFLVPERGQGSQPSREPPPALVCFEWGTFSFQGVAETYRETLDFFSADGIPLRSSINLTL